jgi:DNA polymerase-3 subunit delta'
MQELNSVNHIIGQDRVKKILRSSIDSKRLAHAYLFHGPPGVGKDAVALALTMELNCLNHVPWGCGECKHCVQISKLESPAIQFVFPTPTRPKSMNQDKYNELVREKALERLGNPYREITFGPTITTLPNIGIDPIRTLKHEATLKQGMDVTRVFVISQVERMTIPAANSLLKLLEEPPPRTHLLLTSSAPNRILPTITSRCQMIRFDSLPADLMKEALISRFDYDEENAHFFARMSGGSLDRALSLADGDFEVRRNAAWQFFESTLHGNHLKRMEVCDTLLKDSDKMEVKSILQLLLTILRDLLCIQSGKPERIMNVDRLHALEKTSDQHEDLDIEFAISQVEQSIDLIEKNVYLNLIVHNLSQGMQALAVSKKL